MKMKRLLLFALWLVAGVGLAQEMPKIPVDPPVCEDGWGF